MKHSSHLTSLSFVAISTLLAVAAHAAVTVSDSITAPTEGIFAYNEPEGPYGGENGTSAYYTGQKRTGTNAQYRQVGTAFTLGAGQGGDLTSVTWKIASTSSALPLGKSFSIDIYRTLDQGSAPSSSTLVASQQGVLPVLTPTQDIYLTFTLDTPVELLSDSTYVVVFAFAEPTSTNTSVNGFGFYTTGNAVPNSDWQRWLFEGGHQDPALDLWKTTTDNPLGSGVGNRNQPIIYLGGTAIPEPSTYTMALVGVGGWWMGMRFFRRQQKGTL